MGVPVVAQWKWIRLVSMRTWVQPLASLSGCRIQHCHRCSLDPTLLWLWHRLATVAPIWLLAWELSCAVGVVLKSKKKKEKRKSINTGVPTMAQRKWIRLGTMRLQDRSLASISGLRIQRYGELWCRSQDAAWIWCCCGCGVDWQLQLQLDP